MNGKGKIAQGRDDSEYITPAYNWEMEGDFDFRSQI